MMVRTFAHPLASPSRWSPLLLLLALLLVITSLLPAARPQPAPPPRPLMRPFSRCPPRLPRRSTHCRPNWWASLKSRPSAPPLLQPGGLETGATYEFRVSAANKDGWHGPSTDPITVTMSSGADGNGGLQPGFHSGVVRVQQGLTGGERLIGSPVCVRVEAWVSPADTSLPTPTITSLSPAHVTPGGPDFTLTVVSMGCNR